MDTLHPLEMDIRGPTWNTMAGILLERLRSGGGEGAGVRNFWRGVREKGGSSEPPEPPLVTGLIRSD